MHSDIVHLAYSSSFVFCLFFFHMCGNSLVGGVACGNETKSLQSCGGTGRKIPKKNNIFAGNGDSHQYFDNTEITPSVGDD